MTTASQATDKVTELEDLKAQFEELISQARKIMHNTGMVGKRAEAYWINHIAACLDDRGCMVTLQDTIDELGDLGNFEPDEIDADVCPECGCQPGEGYTSNCESCQSVASDFYDRAYGS